MAAESSKPLESGDKGAWALTSTKLFAGWNRHTRASRVIRSDERKGSDQPLSNNPTFRGSDNRRARLLDCVTTGWI